MSPSLNPHFLVKNSSAISEGLNNTSVNLLSALNPFKLPEGDISEMSEEEVASDFFSDSFETSLASEEDSREEVL